MSKLCECGADIVICQICGDNECSGGPTTCYKTMKIFWIDGKGNVCKNCLILAVKEKWVNEMKETLTEKPKEERKGGEDDGKKGK